MTTQTLNKPKGIPSRFTPHIALLRTAMEKHGDIYEAVKNEPSLAVIGLKKPKDIHSLSQFVGKRMHKGKWRNLPSDDARERMEAPPARGMTPMKFRQFKPAVAGVIMRSNGAAPAIMVNFCPCCKADFAEARGMLNGAELRACYRCGFDVEAFNAKLKTV